MKNPMRKGFTALLTAVLLAASCLPALAASKNTVDRVPYVKEDANLSMLGAAKSVIALKSEGGSFEASEHFRLTLGSDAKWNPTLDSGGEVAAPTGPAAQQTIPSTNTAGASVSSVLISTHTLDVTFNKAGGFPENAVFYIPMDVELTGETGEHNVTIDPFDSTLSSGKLTYAYTPGGNPANITIDKTKIQLGKRAQPGGDIMITESKAGAIRTDTGNELFVRVPASLRGISFASATVRVVVGDLSIDKNAKVVSEDGKKLSIRITGESSKPSTIKITGITIDSDQTVPEGDFKLEIGGPALFGDIQKYFPSSNDFIAFVYGTMITPAPENFLPKVEFTDKSATYRLLANAIWSTRQLDSPAFIASGRVYIPLRAAAEALGASNIQWNGVTHEAIISIDSKTLRIRADSTLLEVNGLQLTMDAPCLNKNSRLMVPVSQIALALGVKSTWNEVTRTATLGF